MMTKYCPKCKTDKTIKEFGNNKTRRDGLQSQCKECRNNHASNKYESNASVHKRVVESRRKALRTENRNRLYEYLLDKNCVDCGDSRIQVLEFDHVRGVKRDNISNLISHKWEVIAEELEKCDVRCANCHRICSGKVLGWFRHNM